MNRLTCDDCGAESPIEYRHPSNRRQALNAHVCGERRCAECRFHRHEKKSLLCKHCRRHPGIRDKHKRNRWDKGNPQREAFIEDCETLASAGLSTRQVAARLGLQRDSVWRNLKRAGRSDLWKKMRSNEEQ